MKPTTSLALAMLTFARVRRAHGEPAEAQALHDPDPLRSEGVKRSIRALVVDYQRA